MALVSEFKLDAQQKEFLNRVCIDKRNVWIKGFPGSGKSDLLAYTVIKILSRSPSSSVLLIAFTRSLVERFLEDLREKGFIFDKYGASYNLLEFNKQKFRFSIDTYYGFMKSSTNYNYILCDEVQDLTPRVLREMNSRCEHIVVAGDSNQSIYDKDPKWQEATVTQSEILPLINGIEFELNIIHRLSKSIIDAVQRFLPRMNIFNSKRDMTKHDTQIRLCEAHSEEQEVKYIMNQATEAVNQGYTAAVLIPMKNKILSFVNYALKNKGKDEWTVELNQYGKIDFGALNKYLQHCGIKMQYVGNGYGQFAENDHRIILMTFHSAKGLDFENVFIPFANSSMWIDYNESIAKTLFMVAMTRARENLYITYYGYPSDYLDSFKTNCSNIDISREISVPQSSSSTSNNPWGF